MSKTATTSLKKLPTAVLAGLLAIVSSSVAVADDLLEFFAANRLELFTTPGVSGIVPPPNVLYLLDNSVSMQSGITLEDSSDYGLFEVAGFSYDQVLPVPETARAGQQQVAPDLAAVAAWNAGVHYAADGSVLHPDLLGVWRLRNADFNQNYYDPAITYAPWPGVDINGDPFAKTEAFGLWNPWLADTTGSNRVELTRPASYSTAVATDELGVNVSLPVSCPEAELLVPLPCDPANDLQYRITQYHQWNDSNRNGLVDADEDGGQILISAATSEYPRAATRTDCANANFCSYAEELRNFSTWFSYHRSREHVAKASIARLLVNQIGVRAGLRGVHAGQLNEPIGLVDSVMSDQLIGLLAELYSSPVSEAGSPLRTALNEAGELFSCSGAAACPIVSEALGGACQSNYAVLVTDGYDSAHSCIAESGHANSCIDLPRDESPISVANLPLSSNADGNDDSVFDGGAYADPYSGTLADVAMHWYERDINSSRSGIQRMLTWAIHMEGRGTVDRQPSDTAEAFNWPNPDQNAGGYVPGHSLDDLRHAAFDGRGGYLSAFDTSEIGRLAGALQRNAGAAVSGSGAGGAISSGALLDDSLFYLSTYDLGEWTGDLEAFEVNADGTLGGRRWSAAAAVEQQAANSRTILTFEPVAREGVPFRADSLDPSVWALGGEIPAELTNALNAVLVPLRILYAIPCLLGTDDLDPDLHDIICDGGGLLNLPKGLDEERINWLRGDRSQEAGGAGGGNLRARAGVLGPLVNSKPILVGPPAFDYADASYRTFRAEYRDRAPVIYVGGNDGMLHGFHAETGEELLAYVPGRLLGKVGELAEQDPQRYQRPYVDGQLSAVDVYDRFKACPGGPDNPQACWRTLLVGGLRGGGQGYFALDITNPDNPLLPGHFSESNANLIVQWEFADRPGVLLGSLENNLLQLVDLLVEPGGLVPIGLPGVLDAGDLLAFLIPGNYGQYADPDLGYTYGQASIVRLPGNADDQWAVVFGNGYNNTDIDLELGENSQELASFAFSLTGNAVLFGVDAATGAKSDALTANTGVGEFIKLLSLAAGQIDQAEQITVGGGNLNDAVNDLDDLLVNLNDPDLVDAILDPVGAANGLSAPAAVDFDAGLQDGRVNHIYAGDLLGNLWRINVEVVGGVPTFEWFAPLSGPAGIDIAGAAAKPLFNTTLFAKSLQPITVKPEVLRHATGNGTTVVVGTGQYLEAADAILPGNPPEQAIYGLWDNGEYAQAVLGTAKLLERSVVAEASEVVDTDGDGSPDTPVEFRITSSAADAGSSDQTPDWSGSDPHRGWYLPLLTPGGAAEGERVIADPVARNGRIVLASLIPDDSVCTAGGLSWIYELRGTDGDRLGASPFDLDGNGFFDQDDAVTDGFGGEKRYVSGRLSTVGVTGVPTMMVGGAGQELHFSVGSSGDAEVLKGNPNAPERSRSTWREVR